MSTLVLPDAEDTIAAIATAPGRGAVALVRVSGPRAIAVAQRLIPALDPAQVQRARLLPIHDSVDDGIIDHGLVTVFQRPRSYTGEDMVEISVHGGTVVPSLVLRALVTAGARQALPGEFTRRAVANGRMDLLQAEAIADIVDARSTMAHRVAIRQLEGGLSRRTAALREAILNLEALIAYDIDFPDEDEGVIDRSRIAAASQEVLRGLRKLAGTANAGEMVREGALVVIGGAPNAGKSSLFNALVGHQRAIVTDIPGTTRDAIEAVIEIHEWPVRLVDTAGLRESVDVVERIGIEISERYLGRANVILLCAESSSELAGLAERAARITKAPYVLIRSKSDLDESPRPIAADATMISVSAMTGEGLTALTDRVASLLSEQFAGDVDEAPLLTRERHRHAVSAAESEVLAFHEAWDRKELPSSVAAIHLREAAHHLAELIGTVEVDDILARVFSTFCVGK